MMNMNMKMNMNMNNISDKAFDFISCDTYIVNRYETALKMFI